eukprot:sb/3468015/
MMWIRALQNTFWQGPENWVLHPVLPLSVFNLFCLSSYSREMDTFSPHHQQHHGTNHTSKCCKFICPYCLFIYCVQLMLPRPSRRQNGTYQTKTLSNAKRYLDPEQLQGELSAIVTHTRVVCGLLSVWLIITHSSPPTPQWSLPSLNKAQCVPNMLRNGPFSLKKRPRKFGSTSSPTPYLCSIFFVCLHIHGKWIHSHLITNNITVPIIHQNAVSSSVRIVCSFILENVPQTDLYTINIKADQDPREGKTLPIRPRPSQRQNVTSIQNNSKLHAEA